MKDTKKDTILTGFSLRHSAHFEAFTGQSQVFAVRPISFLKRYIFAFFFQIERVSAPMKKSSES